MTKGTFKWRAVTTAEVTIVAVPAAKNTSQRSSTRSERPISTLPLFVAQVTDNKCSDTDALSAQVTEHLTNLVFSRLVDG